MSTIIARSSQILLPYLRQCGFANSHAKIGLALTLGSIFGAKVSTDEQKRALLERSITFYRLCGVKAEHQSDLELKKTVWQTVTSVVNVVKASPLFYVVYHAIHPSELSRSQHLLRSCGRGMAGTLASIPAMLLFYGVAAASMPVISSRLQDRGYDKKAADSSSQTAVFVGIGSPLEFGVEALGCGITPTQLSLGPALLGTSAIAGRLAAGVLLQYRAVGESQSDDYVEDSKRKWRDFTYSWLGTTFAQHAINGSMQTITHRHGMMGIYNYFRYGATSGTGSLQRAALRFAGTGFQRFVFMMYWNHLNHQSQELPSWMHPQERLLE